MADGPNRYSYVGGNPVGKRDPTGRQGKPSQPADPPGAAADPAQAGQSPPAPKPASLDDVPDIVPGPPHGSSDGGDDSGDDDLLPVQGLTRGQGASDVGAGKSMLEIMYSRAGGDSLSVYARHTLKDSPHTTIGAQIAADPSDVRHGYGTATGVLHLAKFHDPDQWGDVSLYLEPYAKRDASGFSYGGAAIGTASWDVNESLSLDINATIAVDQRVLSSDSALKIGPAGLFGVGLDFTVKALTDPGKRLYLYPEAGVGWQSGPQLTPPALLGTASNVQYYAGLGIGTDYLKRINIPFVGAYIGVQKQVWTPAIGLPTLPEKISPPATAVFNLETAW